MILSGSAVQEKGFGLSLVSATKRLMAAWSSTTHRKTPRFSRCLASLAKKPSTALSHEHEVGVKWKAKRGCRSSHWPITPLTKDEAIPLTQGGTRWRGRRGHPQSELGG